MSSPRIIVALDCPDPVTAIKYAEQLDPKHCRLKVGKELFTRSGPDLIEKLVARQFDIFLDLKFHDIPNTVAQACKAAADLGVWMINVHVAGGRQMLISAREAIDKAGHRPVLVGVTVLTSLSAGDLQELGVNASPEAQVLRLAQLAKQTRLDGVVCSALEVSRLRAELGNEFCLVTPGIRPAGHTADDQKRTMTPAEAIQAGSDYLVIGRPILQADDPNKALIKIEQEINVIA